MTFYEAIETVGKVIDGVGVAVIALGALLSAGWALTRLRAGNVDVYRTFRERLGRSILLGLEFLVAADIIRTVAVTPDAGSVAVLAGIVLIRTFLSFSLQLEVTGYWPWQAARARQQQAGPQTPQPVQSQARHARPEAPAQTWRGRS
ncbi:DUF1622 domain-containing protein [Mycolicibacterium sp.]|jgi:uncharacterized membrane protein|uniref:DUF1622 domain-containing protein n=1 Tax=Mycolicibacterium sp. TaxID=2320850 RepID=UPI0028A6C8D8|nr:DUF1622 domain-containing protein [Mycolicibacterium sp.]